MSDLNVRARHVTQKDTYERIMVSEASRKTESDGLKSAGLAVSSLSEFQQRLVAIAQEVEQVTHDAFGRPRRRLSGAALDKAIARRLMEEGLGNHNYKDIAGLLYECEDILKKRTKANKE